MNEYIVKVDFTVKAANEEQAKSIVGHEINKNIPFRGVPYDINDSGIINFLNYGPYPK